MHASLARGLASTARARGTIGIGNCILAFALLCLSLGWVRTANAQSSICAEVKIQIDQKVSLERQAFDAALKIRNGLEGLQVERIDVNLVIRHLNGGDAHALFYSDLDTTSAISGSVQDGTGVVAAGTTGEAHWLIIPSVGAGGSGTGEQYEIGATISYRMTGEETDRNIEVIPEIVTVRPLPKLRLDYFLPFDVFADDPLTDPEVEPIVPFTLGVLIRNVGAGEASHVRIESAQPRIIDNDQGLLIGFLIEGGYVGDEQQQPSLLLDFGDIGPQQARIGRWVMTTTLSGQFTEFSAEYAHADELGGELTSVIELPIHTHRLIHDVLVDIGQHDHVRDFLTQAFDAQDIDPYKVHDSSVLEPLDVLEQFAPEFEGNGNTVPYTLSFPSEAPGFLVYARLPFNFDELTTPVSAVRSDGRVVNPANIWLSMRRDATGESWDKYLNLFEADSATCPGNTCTYTLTFNGAPTAPSISGLVYEDVNANGIQDAGEPGLPSVMVSSSRDGAIPVSTTTSLDGAYAFANLLPGTYSVIVASLAQHSDGAHTAGSAGGTVSASSIDGVVLQASVQATGYLFAKVPIPPDPVADLQVTALTASTTTPRESEEFALTLQVANAGPDAAGATAAVVLPSTLELLSNSASAGTFDSATGIWSVGELQAGAGASLVLQVRASAEGQIPVSASIASTDSSILDPQPGNDSAVLELDVGPSTEVTVTMEFARESRVLAFIDCVRGSDPDCEEERVQSLEAYLAGHAVEHRVTADADTFRAELRSGRWNVYWIDNGPSRLHVDVLLEVGVAVHRGDTLILDGTHGNDTAAYDAWAGASYIGPRESTESETVTFLPNGDLAFTGLAVEGAKDDYDVTTGIVLAQYPDAEPAVVRGTHGDGHVFLFAYDLIDSLVGESAYAPLFEQLVQASRPAEPPFFMPDAYVPLNLHVENLGLALTVDEQVVSPIGARVIAAAPAPRQATGGSVVWTKHLDSGDAFESSVGVRLQPMGTVPVTVDLSEAGGDGTSLAHDEFTPVVRSASQQASQVSDAISSLPVSGSEDLANRDAILQLIAGAMSEHADGSVEVAIGLLLKADRGLAGITTADTKLVRVELGWLMQAWEREWYVALSTCNAAGDMPVVDGGTSFTPFFATEGLILRQGGSGFDWRLGANTQTPSASVGAHVSLSNGETYDWNLSYDAAGTGALGFCGPPPVACVQLPYTLPLANGEFPLRSGNGLHLQVLASAGTGSTSINVTTTELDGLAFAHSIGAAAASVSQADSIHFYGEALADGFSLAGTISVIVPPSFGNPPPRLTFSVNAGMLACELPER